MRVLGPRFLSQSSLRSLYFYCPGECKWGRGQANEGPSEFCIPIRSPQTCCMQVQHADVQCRGYTVYFRGCEPRSRSFPLEFNLPPQFGTHYTPSFYKYFNNSVTHADFPLENVALEFQRGAHTLALPFFAIFTTMGYS